MMNGYFDGTAYDSEKLLKQLDSMDEEKKSTPKEIRLRFSERQYEILKSSHGLGLKEKLNIMYAVIDFIVKQVKNGVDV
jgi:cobalamin biosynthesis Co2+ chelatase CbiK